MFEKLHKNNIWNANYKIIFQSDLKGWCVTAGHSQKYNFAFVFSKIIKMYTMKEVKTKHKSIKRITHNKYSNDSNWLKIAHRCNKQLNKDGTNKTIKSFAPNIGCMFFGFFFPPQFN